MSIHIFTYIFYAALDRATMNVAATHNSAYDSQKHSNVLLQSCNYLMSLRINEMPLVVICVPVNAHIELKSKNEPYACWVKSK